MVSILDSSSRNLQKLIEQLLDYNRKQADSVVELENVELAPLVETGFAHSLPARAKMMHTDVDPKATVVGRSQMPLMSVLDNLYSNAALRAESGNTIFTWCAVILMSSIQARPFRKRNAP